MMAPAVNVLVSPSAAATIALGRALASALGAGDVVALEGDLGSGKTTFVRGVAGGLGADEPAVSPSFVLIREYQGRVPVYHLDLYRLEEERELHKIGVADYLAGDGVALVEWSGRLGSLTPPDRLEVRLVATAREDERRIEFEPHGESWQARFALLWPELASTPGEEAARPPR